jgi:hypothetical protein
MNTGEISDRSGLQKKPSSYYAEEIDLVEPVRDTTATALPK